MKPKISIVTIAYNAEKCIEDTIKSVINQTYDNVEYIIVDGQSTDSTLAICNKYKSQIDILVSEKDKGLYDAMNKGVNLATGDIVGMLNADDFYESNTVLTKVADAFSVNDIDCLYGDLVYVDPFETDKVVRNWVSGIYNSKSFLRGWMPPHPTFFIKKSHYQKYGTYSLKLMSAADYELMLRMIYKHKLRPFYIPETLVRMRTGGVSNASLKNRWLANREDKLAWKMNGLKPGIFTLIRKPLSKITQYFKH